jgi:hypothetical protein
MKRLSLFIAAMSIVAACSSNTGGSTTTGGTATVDAGTAGSTTDTGTSTSKDVAAVDAGATKDTATKDIPPPPTGPSWGICGDGDQGCLQGCVQDNCAAPYSVCQQNKACKALDTCYQNCQAKPVKLPSQVTPLEKAEGEDDQEYCFRVCGTQAGPEAVALNQDAILCLIGYCVDCGATKLLAKSQCIAICGSTNNCTEEHDACFADKACLKTVGCLITCNGDEQCSGKCQDEATPEAVKLLQAYNTCQQGNAKECVAPEE